MAEPVTRRRFLETTAAAGLWIAECGVRSAQCRVRTAQAVFGSQPVPFPVRFRKPNPYERLFSYVEAGHDEFLVERQAAEITAQLERLPESRSLPLAKDFRGLSPMPVRYQTVAEGVFRAEFQREDTRFQEGLERWLNSLGRIRSARFFVLAGDRVRYEIASTGLEGLQYRVGLWEQSWAGGRLARFSPLEETLVTAPRPLFQDVTAAVFDRTESFQQQMLRGVPYWRARLDSASGIDVYGNNGIAVGDMDGDGWDEVYVCQPGGLPNRLYKNLGDGTVEDITERAGVGVLDDTASALFVDFRNSGSQDLVALTIHGPLLFLNQGNGAFRYKPDAFRFATAPQGTFTGMAAADYDLDGRVDLYLCTYIYFQSEDQYRYPAPYHDAQNGPPNFLFRNQLTSAGGGFFEDVTAAVGLNHNNNRYSFAAAWCDYDGDGRPDLYVANDFGRNNLYKNDRGRFRDVAAEAGVEDIGPGMSAAWFDYDGDGLPDLYVSNMWTASGQRLVEDKAFTPAADAALREAYRRHSKGNSLYRNRGDGTFEETGAAEGAEMGRWAWSADGLDFDNDGSPDIYVAAGMLTNSSEKDLASFFWRQVVARSPAIRTPAPAYENGWNALNQLIREDYSWNGRERNVLYARRNGHFYDFSGVSGADFMEDSRAFAATDFDGDGNLDLFLKNRLGPQVRALRNEWGIGRHALVLRLRGKRSNRDAIGASVLVEHAGGRSHQTLQAGSGYLSQHTKQLHFGLGDSRSAGLVRIQWPSGLIQEFHNLAAGFRYEIVEGSTKLQGIPFLRRKLAPGAHLAAAEENQPRFEPTWLLQPVPLPDSRKGPGFLCLVAGEGVTPPAGLPFEVLDLRKESPDLAAWYALFRRYLLDYRTDLTLPLLILVDERGMAHKLYPTIPEASTLRDDLRALKDPDRARLALPFSGQYYAPPRGNYFRLGAAFFWAGYPEQAVVYLKEVLRQAPDNFLAHLTIGQIDLEAGRHGPARAHLERAVALNPNSPEAWTNLGGVEMAAGNYSAALRNFETALAVRPDWPYALLNGGRAHLKLGNPQVAEKMFHRVLELDGGDADAANQLGLLMAGQNRTGEARKYFQQAIAARRDHSAAIHNLGVLYAQTQKFQDAIAAFQYGLEVAPEDEMMYLNLARVYVRLGERGKAREVLQRLLARKPDSSVARKALQELGEP